MFTYKDFRTSRIKRTHGVFAGWLEPSSIMPMRRAVFKTAKRELRIMEMCLTAETKAAIAEIEEANRAKEATS